LFPTLDSGGERRVDVVEGLFGGGVAGLAQAVKDAAGFGDLARLVAQEGVFESDLAVVRVGAHSLLKLIAGERSFADLEIGIGEVLADGGSRGGGRERLEKAGNGAIVVADAEGVIGRLGGVEILSGATASEAECGYKPARGPGS